tara:strand:+ start:52 stop:1368 length:1317 start_codon:yes stop_codon:yes gene_type:complete
MSQYFDKNDLFLDPKVKQYGSHMVMSNVHKPTKTKYVNIDTKFSDEYNDFSVANYTITLPERINDIKSLTVTNMELPMSFYNISSALGNNSFQITNLDVLSSAPYLTSISSGSVNDNNRFVDTIVIPDGDYTIEELKTTINSQIDKLNRIPNLNANGNIVVDENGEIVYSGSVPLVLTSQNSVFEDGAVKYIKWGDEGHPDDSEAGYIQGTYVKDIYGNHKITRINTAGGDNFYNYVSNELKNTNDLRFDYYEKCDLGYQGYLYSNGSTMEVDFAVNATGQFDKYNFKSKIGWALGFRKLNYTIIYERDASRENTDGFGPDGQQLTYGEFLVDLNSTRYVYLALEEFNKGNQNSFVSPTASSFINKNIIARISLDRANYGFGHYLPANKQNGLLLSDVRGYSGKIDLHKINLQLVNDIGTPLPLNGYDFSLCLEVEHD